MEKRELDLFEHLLEYAEELMGRRGCNDLPSEMLEGWSDLDKKKFRHKYYDKYRDGPKEDFHPLHSDWWAFACLKRQVLQIMRER